VAGPAKVLRGPTLREASFEDFEQIASLESRYGLEAKNSEEWRHLWLANPLYRELQPGWSIGWVIEDENKNIVASIGNIPLLYEFEGKLIVAASGRCEVAEPPYRSATLLLLDRLINQPGVDLYLNNTITSEAAPSFSAFECPRVPVGVWDESAFWVTHYQGFFQSLMVMKNYPWARPLSYLLSGVGFVKDKLRKTGLPASDVEVKPCGGFDDRFDDFWEQLKSNNPQWLLAVRTRRWLEWHFKHALLRNEVWIVTVVDGSRLAAYAVFDRKDNLKFGLKRVRLVDFQSLDRSPALLAPMLAWALRRCREEGIHMLENIGRWLEPGEFIQKIAPYQRRLGTWTYFYRANIPALEESLNDPAAWVPSLYDGNASL